MVSDEIKRFLDFVAESKKIYDMASEAMHLEEKKTQDFLHAIEFEVSAKERSKICTRLHRSRQERRRNKDLVQIYEPVVQYFQGASGKKFLEELRQLLGRQRKAEQYVTGHREYRKRIDDGR